MELHEFLTKPLGEAKWSASHPSYFTPGKRTPEPIKQKTRWTSEPV